jgi:hypothetical protein
MAAHGTLPGDAGQTDHRLINDLFAVNHLRHTKLLSGEYQRAVAEEMVPLATQNSEESARKPL